MSKQRIKVAVLMGGPSAEHEVSLNTGRQIIAHLDPKKYIAEAVTIEKSGRWVLAPVQSGKQSPGIPSGKSLALSEAPAAHRLREKRVDVVFVALHGKYGEDGTVQGLLELFRMPFTGSGVLASALGMNKPRSLAIFREAGLAVPDFQVIYGSELKKGKTDLFQTLIRRFSLPLVVKPADHGSSVGVSIVKKKGDMPKAVRNAMEHCQEVIVQKFIRGTELTCGVLERKGGKLFALPPIEIVPNLSGFYDYTSKYAEGGSDHFIPPRGVTPARIRAVQDAAVRAHKAIGAAGMSRSDFILSPEGTLYILEINTIPGMTQTSLLPQSAAAAGISFPQLLDMIIQSALQK